MPVSPKHPRHLSKCASPILHVTQPESDGNAIKRSLGKWQLHRIGKNCLAHSFSLCQFQHFRQEIHACDFRLRQLLLQRKRQISRASSKIDDFDRAPACDRVGSPLSPIKIDAAAKCVISEIVPSGNGAKHFPNSCGLCCGTGFCHLKEDKTSTHDSMITHFLFTTCM